MNVPQARDFSSTRESKVHYYVTPLVDRAEGTR
jgi:hypothetical protein